MNCCNADSDLVPLQAQVASLQQALRQTTSECGSLTTSLRTEQSARESLAQELDDTQDDLDDCEEHRKECTCEVRAIPDRQHKNAHNSLSQELKNNLDACFRHRKECTCKVRMRLNTQQRQKHAWCRVLFCFGQHYAEQVCTVKHTRGFTKDLPSQQPTLCSSPVDLCTSPAKSCAPSPD